MSYSPIRCDRNVIMVTMSYFCLQNGSQISLKMVVNCSHPSEILAFLFQKVSASTSFHENKILAKICRSTVAKAYGKCSKILSTFFVQFYNLMMVFRAGI